MRPSARRDQLSRGRQELATTRLPLPKLGPAGVQERLPQPPSVGQRLRVRFSRWRLDREIAEGGPLHASDLHAFRARQLCDPLIRHGVAVSLRRVVGDAEQPYVVLNSVSLGRAEVLLPLLGAEVLAWREGLLGLAERLDDRGPVNPCGVARARVLVSDATGPLYAPDPPRLLGETIWWIADGLPLCPPRRRGMSGARQAGSGADRPDL